jgi:hypothetical protein
MSLIKNNKNIDELNLIGNNRENRKILEKANKIRKN